MFLFHSAPFCKLCIYIIFQITCNVIIVTFNEVYWDCHILPVACFAGTKQTLRTTVPSVFTFLKQWDSIVH